MARLFLLFAVFSLFLNQVCLAEITENVLNNDVQNGFLDGKAPEPSSKNEVQGARFAAPTEKKQDDTSSRTPVVFGMTQPKGNCTGELVVVLRVAGKLLAHPFQILRTMGEATHYFVTHFYGITIAPLLSDINFAFKATWDAVTNCTGKSFQEVQVGYRQPCLKALEDAARRYLLVITNRWDVVERLFAYLLHLVFYSYFQILVPVFGDIILLIKSVVSAFKTCTGISKSLQIL